MQIIKVMWEGINELDIRTLTEMSEDVIFLRLMMEGFKKS